MPSCTGVARKEDLSKFGKMDVQRAAVLLKWGLPPFVAHALVCPNVVSEWGTAVGRRDCRRQTTKTNTCRLCLLTLSPSLAELLC